MSLGEKKRRRREQRLVVEAVAARIDHDLARVSQLTNAAKSTDAGHALWNLTDLAAAAIEELASATGRSTHETLEALAAANFGGYFSPRATVEVNALLAEHD